MNHVTEIDDDTDWCMDEERITTWDEEVCLSCGRIWGHETGEEHVVIPAH